MTETLENLRNFNYYAFKVEPSITVAEYIFIDGTGARTRGKTKVLRRPVKKLEDLDWWTYDGSSTDQATTQDSEIFIKPVAFFPDPFRQGPHVLVLAETYRADKVTPARYNFRHICEAILNEARDFKPQFGIEQEYFFMKRTGTNFYWPLGWPAGGYPRPQGQYYCGVGESNVYGRAIAEAHLRLCLNAGLAIGGVNVEVAPGQFEYQVGVTDGIKAADEFWIARYILERVGEEFGVDIDYEPKPIKGDWNGSGGHCNFSTVQSRGEGGYEFIKQNYIPALDKTHRDILELYGANNRQRLTGKHETSSFEKFSWGDGSRAGSVRIPAITKHSGKGYLEDRRPAANLDAYLVTAALASVCCLGGKHLSKLKDALIKSSQPLLHAH